jgi:mono/diheme cytochrome c family protein
MRNLCTAFVCFSTLAILASSATLARADKIERTWQAKCSACHGDDGKGSTAKGKEMAVNDLSAADIQKGLTDAQIQKAIEDGVNTTTKDGKKQQMDAYKDKLKPDQIADLVKYIRTLAGK